MRRPQRLEPAGAQRILFLRFSRYMSVTSISRQVRCSPSLVYQVLRTFYTSPHTPTSTRERPALEMRIGEITRMRTDGLSIDEIAEKLDLPRRAVGTIAEFAEHLKESPG